MKKFYAVVGNPPYQEEFSDEGNKAFSPPIYNFFMDEAEKVAEKVELITPARFLFDAGSTPKIWNKKKLNDPHFKVIHYEGNASTFFPDTDIKGGVAITLRDSASVFEPIGTFTPYEELLSASHKVWKYANSPLSDIIFTQNRFNLDSLYADHPNFKKIIGSNGSDKRFRNNIFEKIDVFSENPTQEDDISVIGVIGNKRCRRFIPRKYVDMGHENIASYKLAVPRVNGKGLLGETLSTPVVLRPYEGYTQTFIGIGSCSSKDEACSIEKYVRTKFARALLGIKKITQDNERDTWSKIPLQDFTSSSDIDWSQSVADIDRQLYRKYGLDDAEIEFIESHVKEMG